jgi:hypothetical protein
MRLQLTVIIGLVAAAQLRWQSYRLDAGNGAAVRSKRQLNEHSAERGLSCDQFLSSRLV